jgi:periplasmic protein TonB
MNDEMSYLPAIRNDETLKRFLLASLALHLVIASFAVLRLYLSRPTEGWGGPGGAITVGVVGSVPAIPLPHPDVESPNRVVDESKGLFKAEPKPLPKPEADATPIPKFERNKPPKYITKPSKVLENRIPPPPNAIPYGGGGAPTVPTTSFAIGAGTTQAGMAFNGNGGGDFGSRFSWYVEGVQRRISGNWLQSTVDPSLAYAQRVVVTFTILRSGDVANVQVTHSSNNASVDNSAVRAVLESKPLDRLPAAYAGSNVNCEFWFDYKR